MPIRGEAENRPSYVNLERIGDSTQLLHRCSHAVLGIDCVQKTVPIGGGSVAMFEPRLLEELEHPRIPPIREAQYDPDYPNRVTFIMPWYAGGSVARALIEGHQFSICETTQIVRDVLDALEYLHTRRRYVHRDIKTSNVLLDSARQRGYLTDFGLAAALDPDGTSSAVLSTYHYLAPECVTTQRHGPVTDLYGVGMILFEMLNGRFRWEDIDQAVVERRIISGKRSVPDRVLSPQAFEPHIPDQLVRLTRKALRASPDDRFGSAAEFMRQLSQVVTIDWRPAQSPGIDGEWIGSWPPQAQRLRRDEYRVTSSLLRAGQRRGGRRLIASYRKAGTAEWRRIGITDRTVGADDSAAVRQFFSDVAANASHRRAAR